MQLVKGKQLTAKSIRMNLKHGWTIKDFCNAYGISEKLFWDYANSFFCGNTGDIKRKLKKNQSIRKSSSKHTQNQESELTEKQEVCSENCVEADEEPEAGYVGEKEELKTNSEKNEESPEIKLTQAGAQELLEQ